MNKWAYIDFSICKPLNCDWKQGICVASKVCKKKLLEQEEPFEVPALLSSKLCGGCSHCVRSCPYGAVRIESVL